MDATRARAKAAGSEGGRAPDGETRRLAALRRLATGLAAGETLEGFAGRVALAALETLPWDAVEFCVLEEGQLLVRAAFPASLPWFAPGTRIRDQSALPWLAVHSRRVCRADLSPSASDGDGEPGWPADPSFRSALAVPLRAEQAVIGTLSLLSTRPDSGSEDDADFAEALGGTLAGVLEIRRLRRELRETNLDWEETFASVEDLLAVIDRDGRILRVNHDYGGRSVDEMIGRRGAEVFAFCGDGDGAFSLKDPLPRHAAVLEESAGPDLERALDVSARPVHGHAGRPAKLLLCARDVTARRRMESQLFQSAKLAAVGEMAAGVAHELNSPLTAVIGNANLLLRRTPPDDKAYRMLSDIKMCGQRCKKIITHMLTFARQDSYVLEPLHLNDVVTTGLGLIEYQLSKCDIQVERRLNPGLPAVFGNPQQIEQVLVNLLLNARDALEGRAEKSITVTTGFSEFGEGRLGAALTVSDTGAGIPQRNRERIFDPFFTTKETMKGTGLGLSVSMGIAKAHGGTLTVQSRPGGGSAFTLALPFPEQRLALGSGGEARPLAALPAELLERLRPSLELARKLGRLHAQLGPDGPITLELEGTTDEAAWGTGLLAAAALSGLLATPNADLDLADARRIARERGVRVREAAAAHGADPAFTVQVRLETSAGTRTLAGALFARHDPRLVAIDGVPIEAVLQGHLLLFWAHDRPGLAGSIAALLEAHAIGVLQMRSAAAGGAATALAAFHVDRPVGDEVVAALGRLPGLVRVARATL